MFDDVVFSILLLFSLYLVIIMYWTSYSKSLFNTSRLPAYTVKVAVHTWGNFTLVTRQVKHCVNYLRTYNYKESNFKVVNLATSYLIPMHIIWSQKTRSFTTEIMFLVYLDRVKSACTISIHISRREYLYFFWFTFWGEWNVC